MCIVYLITEDEPQQAEIPFFTVNHCSKLLQIDVEDIISEEEFTRSHGGKQSALYTTITPHNDEYSLISFHNQCGRAHVVMGPTSAL